MVARRVTRALPFFVALVVSALLGAVAVSTILEATGRPAAPLDDTFIHFQFARRMAEGAPLRYTGDALSTGATSLLWPGVLSPFWRLGARGLSLLWVTWVIGTVCHAGVAVETGLLAGRLTGRVGALTAAGACLAFGPFAWFAWSGMETMALAWALVATARRAAEVLESEKAPSTRALGVLSALGFVAPLVRPEGALAALMACVALVLTRRRWLAVLPIGGALALPATYWLLTGSPASATARAKWLFYNPYYDAGRLFTQTWVNARAVLFDVLDGGEWTAGMVPRGLAVTIVLGAPALALSARRARWAAAATLALAVGALIPCTYQTLFWNRVRYVWPFVPAAFVMIACLVHEAGERLSKLRRPLAVAAPALGGALVARAAADLPASIADLARSAAAVDAQHVEMAEWARLALSGSALVGVNDTGAIAYLGERRTFDLVGLTTEGESRAWLAGAGSRFERYERAPRDALPTHFIVYPEWFGCDVLLGEELHRLTVEDHAILGGDSMVAFTADLSALGSGARSSLAPDDTSLLDELDVADLESEAAHAYVLGSTQDTDDVVITHEIQGGRVVDGGRLARSRDAFDMALPPRGSRLVMRAGAAQITTLEVLVNGELAGTVTLEAAPWSEVAIGLPPGKQGRSRVEVVALGGARFASLHYWLHERPTSERAR